MKHRFALLALTALVLVACSTSDRRSTVAVSPAAMPSTAWSTEIVGDFGHQHSGSTIDPDGHPKADPEMVWFEVPKGHTATVTHGIRNGGWESKIVLYKDDARSEVMRFATNPAHESKTDTVLQSGVRYYFTAWHKAGDMSMPWDPSHARLMVKTITTFELQQDDGLAGTNKGDFDFNDFNLIITVK